MHSVHRQNKFVVHPESVRFRALFFNPLCFSQPHTTSSYALSEKKADLAGKRFIRGLDDMLGSKYSVSAL